MVINGALECGSSPSNPTGAAYRVKFYKRFAKRFGLDISGEKLGCKDSRPFSTGGSAGSVGLYWAPETGCTLVSWQTAFSSLVEGDYKACRQGKHLECNLSVAELPPIPPTLPTQRPTKLPTRRPTLPPTPPTLPTQRPTRRPTEGSTQGPTTHRTSQRPTWSKPSGDNNCWRRICKKKAINGGTRRTCTFVRG